MSESLNYRDARNLCKDFRGMLNRFSYIQKKYYEFLTELQTLANQCRENQVFDQVLENGLAGYEETYSDARLRQFIHALWRVNESKPVVAEIWRLNRIYSDRWEGCLRFFRYKTNPLAQIFMTKNTKLAAKSTYSSLESFYRSEDYPKLVECFERFDAIEKQDVSNAVFDFAKDPSRFYECAKEATKAWNSTYVDARFREHYEAWDDIKKQKESFETMEERLRKDIVEAAEILHSEMVESKLSSVPVKEINRDKAGIRVKCLIDGDYETIADILDADVMDLCDLDGISYDGALTIMKRAEQIADDFADSTHIRLSADHRTSFSTRLVQSLYRWFQYQARTEEVKRLYEELNAESDGIFAVLEKAKNGFVWLFNRVDKEGVRQAHQKAESLFSSPLLRRFEKECRNVKFPKGNAKGAWEDFEKDPIRYTLALEQMVPDLVGDDNAYGDLPEDLVREIQEQCFFPDGLRCSLRRYQEFGVRYILHQEKVLLGDEMGLGKTIQAIAAMVSLKNTGASHFMVICPASVLTNWCREITKHSLLRAYLLRGKERSAAFKEWKKNGGVAVINYESVGTLRFKGDERLDMVIVDEAHYIKNAEAKRTQNTLKVLDLAPRKLLMTGTAIENNVDEMIALIRYLRPDIARELERYTSFSFAPEFRRKVAPVYYRRKREDVLTELPEKEELLEWCTMGKEEEAAYEGALLSNQFMEARRLSWNVDDLNLSSKARRLKELVEEAKGEGRKILVFSFFIKTLQSLYGFLGGQALNPITGQLTVKRRQEILDEFDEAPPGTILLAQIISGGTGLNIQSASVVVICEPQLKPSIENQAISRAYRMGQARNVLVYRLVCENTIDELVLNRLQEKQAEFNAFADRSLAAEVEIDQASLGSIIENEIERIKAKPGNKESVENRSSQDGGEEYYAKLLGMDYSEAVESLLQKYGPAQGDYFLTETCKSRNGKISRASEGLYLHHIDEDKGINLSKSEFAITFPYEYQKANRLVYCNYLEHLVLHILIAEEVEGDDEFPRLGGVMQMMCPQLNDIYHDYPFQQPWMISVASRVKNDRSSYIKMLKLILPLAVNETRMPLDFIEKKLSKGYYGNVYNDILDDLRAE